MTVAKNHSIAKYGGLTQRQYRALDHEGKLRAQLDGAIRTESGCWMWRGAAPGKYGSINRDGKTIQAHRAIYELMFGPIPDGLHVCHRCDRPGCVNPDHLFLGTNLDNVRDSHQKGRHRAVKQHWGEGNPNCKLSEADVDEVRRLHTNGFNYERIAEQFGCGPTHVSRIIRGIKRARG